MKQSPNGKSSLTNDDYVFLKGMLFPEFIRRLRATLEQADGTDDLDFLEGLMDDVQDMWKALNRLCEMQN